ncbi:hypothetical protein ACWY4P_34875 [Streptomyces sp. LZ34]
MRTTLRRLVAPALGAMALLWLPAPSAGAEGFGEVPGLYDIDQAAQCRTSPAIGVGNRGVVTDATGEDTHSTDCDNLATRTDAKQRLECRTDPANALITPQADRRAGTRCFNVALDNRAGHNDRHGDRRGY